MKFTALFISLGLVASTSAVVLDGSNFESATAGKTTFIKFYAPWCGHCKGMKPAWDQLMGEYDGHASILIGDVDCTADSNKDLCSKQGVKGYPTIKYGDVNNLEDYKGGRDLDALQAHASTLGPSCSPANLDLCSEEKKAEIEKVMEESLESLEEFVSKAEAELKKVEETFTSEVQKLQNAYQGLQKDKEEGEAKIKASGLSLRKSVLAEKKKAPSSEKDEL